MKQQTEKQKKQSTRNKFLLSFFSEDKYQEKEVNGFWLVKQFNSGNGKWQVAVYTKESFKSYKNFQQSELF